jgi:RraA family protein
MARRVSPETVEQFRDIPVANVSDSMSRMSASGARIRPMHAGGSLVGPVLTVKTRPGDNLMVHKALDIAEAGDVVVVDAGGDLTTAIIGELMIAHARHRKLAGLVIDGSVRDVAFIRSQEFPVYAAGVTHRGPYKDGPGEINCRIGMDGMVFEPGDLIVGDDDGLVCVSFDDVGLVLEAAVRKRDAERAQMRDIESGKVDRSWVDATLLKLRCET